MRISIHKALVPLCFTLGSLINSALAQEEEFHAPKFEKVNIGESGATVYFPKNDSFQFEMALSEDGSKVYVGEIEEGDFTYGLIFVKFEGFTLDTMEDRESTLIAYLDFLKASSSIVTSAGYGGGHQLARDESAEGIIDFWMDEIGFEWSITGWVRSDAMAVMYIYGAETYPNYSVSQFFFNGLTF